MFDNIGETPPALPYVICTISYTDTTLPVLCQTEGHVEQLNGNLQLAVYVPRGRGMGALELYGSECTKVMNSLPCLGQFSNGERQSRPNQAAWTCPISHDACSH